MHFDFEIKLNIFCRLYIFQDKSYLIFKSYSCLFEIHLKIYLKIFNFGIKVVNKLFLTLKKWKI